MKLTKKELKLLAHRKLTKKDLLEITPTTEILVYGEKRNGLEIYYIYSIKELAYLNNMPKCTVFQDKDDFISYCRNKDNSFNWSTKKLFGLFEGFDGVTYRTNVSEITSILSSSRIAFETSKDFINIIDQKQLDIQKARLNRKHQIIKDRIDTRMKEVPKIPVGFNSWVNKTGASKMLFMQNNIMYFKRNKKVIEGYCTACDSDMILEAASHNTEGKCPNCKHKVTFKSEGRFKKHSAYDSWYLIQKTKRNELLIRFFKGNKCFDGNYKNPTIKYWEATRVFMNQSGKSDFYSYDYFLSTNEIRWREGICSSGMFQSRSNSCMLEYGCVYPTTLKRVFKDTVWQYHNFAERAKKELSMGPVYELSVFAEYPQIEYLNKMGLTKLASNILGNPYSARNCNKEAKTAHEFLNVPKRYLAQLIRLNPNFETLGYYCDLKELLAKKNKFGELVEPNFTDSEFNKIKSILPKSFDVKAVISDTSLTKFFNYVDKQRVKFYDVWKERISSWKEVTDTAINLEVKSEWIDYRRIAKVVEEQFAKKNKRIAPFEIFPQNLKDRHDEVTLLKNEENLKEKSEIIKKLQSNWEPFNYIDQETGLFLTHPKDAFELVNESNKLNHCVKTYIDSVCAEKTNIFFVRDINKPDEPLYTMEYKDNRIIQFRGKGNRAVPQTAEEFRAKWLNKHVPSVTTKIG